MKVVILAGGIGARAYPFTSYLPKPMMPVGGRPILVRVMEIFARQGFSKFVAGKEPDPKAGRKFETLVGKMVKKAFGSLFQLRFPDAAESPAGRMAMLLGDIGWDTPMFAK